MPDGYIRTRPDVGWWMDQVNAGVEYRRKYAREAKWKLWRRYYRGEWRSDILPVNIFFSMLRATVPRVYFRNPAVSVTPRKAGALNLAFAQILNRIDNRLLEQMRVKREIKDMIQDAFLKGTGIGKLGYGAQFSPTILGGDERAPEVGARRERFEYHSEVFANRPWFMRTDPGEFVVPDGVRRMHEGRWVAHWIRRPTDDLKRDPRFSVGREGVPSTVVHLRGENRVVNRVEMTDLVEIRDRKFGEVFVLAPFAARDAAVLYQGPDALIERRFPFFDLIFNLDDEVFWGVPDAQILEPIQLELNETRTQIMKHRRSAIVKFLYEKGTIDDEEVEKILSEDVLAAVQVNELSGIDKLQAANIPPDLLTSLGVALQDAREAIGFSRNQLGEFQTRRGDTSATEAAAVQQGSDIRVDEKRDAVADLLTSVVVEMNEIIFDQWGQREVLEVVGPGGVPVWVDVNPGVLRAGRYHVKVDPDSSTPRTRAQREAKAIGIYNLLKTNPLMDPVKLTQYLLRELEGVELDDLMRSLPNVGEPTSPVSPGDLANMIQEAGRRGAGNLRVLAGGGAA